MQTIEVNVIDLYLLENRSITAKVNGHPIDNQNGYKIIAGEENATQFKIASIPEKYEHYTLTVEMVNSRGYGIAETEIKDKMFTLPVGMAVAGYGQIQIRAKRTIDDEEINVPFYLIKVKVHNTLSNWKENIDPTELDEIKATLTEIQSEINEIPNNYVTKASGSNVAYINDQNGATATKPFAVDVTNNALVARSGNGQIKVPLAPAQDDDAVSKKYVDDADNTKLNKVEPFANGTYAYIVSKDDRFGTTNGYTEISEKDKISTIAKRKTNGCIETRTPYADIEAANKGYVDTAISDTQSQLAQTNQNVEDLYTILEQAQVVTVTTLEQAYTTRETADGENIVDGIDTSVKEIRGKTVAPTNLIPLPYAEVSTTKNGVTFTVNELDGSIVLSGVSTSAASFGLTSPTFYLPAGTYFFSLNSNKALSDSTIFGVANKFQNGSFVGDVATDYGIGDSFSVSASDVSSNSGYRLEIFVRQSGVNCDGYIFYPMLNEGSSALPYKPYFKGLKNASFEKIVSTGRNLILFPYYSKSGVINGITYKVNSDGSILLNGTATANSSFVLVSNLFPIKLDKSKKYVLSGCPSGGGFESYRIFIQDTTYQQGNSDIGNGVIFTTEYTDYYIFIIISEGATVNNLLFKPMLNIGASAPPYEPYISDTLSAETPIELAEFDVAYPETGKTKRQSKTVTFNGTEAWVINTNYTAFSLDLPSKGIAFTSICSPYSAPKITAWDQLKDYEAQNGVLVLLIKDSTYSTVDEWKAHLASLAEAGNPVTVTYKTVEATTEATPFNKSKYIAWKNGSETIEQGPTDNSEYGAEDTVKQDYFTLTGGTTNG